MANVNLEEMKKCTFWGNADDVFMMLYLIDHATAQEINFIGGTLPAGSVITSYKQIASDLGKNFRTVKKAVSSLAEIGALEVRTIGKIIVLVINGFDGLVVSNVNSDTQNTIGVAENTTNVVQNTINDAENTINVAQSTISNCKNSAFAENSGAEESERQEVRTKERTKESNNQEKKAKEDSRVINTKHERQEKDGNVFNDARNYREEAKQVIDYLNNRIGSHYRHSDSSLKHVLARLHDGFTVADCRVVIDKKAAEWQNDPKMAQYLRPETLFGSKFENYLNQPVRMFKNPYLQSLAQEVNNDEQKGSEADPFADLFCLPGTG